MGQLPKFEELVALADRDPEAFESFRQTACQQFIATTPNTHRRRLAAIQNRVEMELKRAKTPMAGLLRVSGMMHDCLYQLSNKLIEFNHPGSIARSPTPRAEVINLLEWKELRQTPQDQLH
ncbi:MAG: DUF3135 domain-containing protein [Halopseudomonas sp.]